MPRVQAIAGAVCMLSNRLTALLVGLIDMLRHDLTL